MDLETSHILIRIIEIVWIDLLLSGDNAVLLAVATRALPQSQRRPPASLRVWRQASRPRALPEPWL